MANQQMFNLKRKQYLIDNAQEVFERLQGNGQLEAMKFFAVTVEYLLSAPKAN